jgi:hypothetical protein
MSYYAVLYRIMQYYSPQRLEKLFVIILGYIMSVKTSVIHASVFCDRKSLTFNSVSQEALIFKRPQCVTP